MEDVAQDTCFGAGSVAGAVIGTFLTTILLLAVAALLYRQWRRHKGKHLVLVTDPETVEDAYAFDNPCFKDATPAVGRVAERPLSTTPVDTPAKDSARWSTPWTSLGLANRNDKRRTLDDSCLGSKATRVSVVSLRSRDFTGLGFNVCGNMREGIFVKDLLHRGPASESGRIHPGDRIASVKISFRNMVYEDALTILSYASPYDVELEVESGGTGSKPTTLLKKSVGPSPTHICHPLYRSQSIPELSQTHKSAAKRLFIADREESVGSNYSTMNSTLKSSKSTPGSHTLERRHEEATKNNHHKFGIKVLPALDGTVHRIENQNEHNTNLERRHSKKMDAEKRGLAGNRISAEMEEKEIRTESLQQRENIEAKLGNRRTEVIGGIDVPDKGEKEEKIIIPSEVPTEVHNAAMAARRNRKNSSELLNAGQKSGENSESSEGPKSPQKNKRKAPAPPKSNANDQVVEIVVPSIKKTPAAYDEKEDNIDSIADYTESLTEYLNKVRETTDVSDARSQRIESCHVANRRNSESDTDSEVQNSFTTIELNPADITIHRTPVPEANDDDDDEDDMYRKAASLGDLSKYESKAAATLERAQSLDMTDTGSKKRKAPLPPEDINESTEDLTKLDQMDTFDRRKLKKSNEWGTLEDVIWNKTEGEEGAKKGRTRKKSNGTLERSKSAVEIKLKENSLEDDRVEDPEDSAELYNLPLSKRLTQEFIHAERMFDPGEDNSLARIVNDGTVVKSPTVEEVELDFRQAKPLPAEEEDENVAGGEDHESSVNEDFSRALRYFEMHSGKPATSPEVGNWKDDRLSNLEGGLYAGKKPVVEEPVSKVQLDTSCRGCSKSHHGEDCKKHGSSEKDRKHQDTSISKNRSLINKPQEPVERSSTPVHLRVHPSKSEISKLQDLKSIDNSEVENKDDPISTFHARRTKFEHKADRYSPIKTKSPVDTSFESHFVKRVISVPNSKEMDPEEDDEEDEYEFGSGVTVNSKNLSCPNDDRHNISNVSVSSGENSEDSGLVRESIDYNPQDPADSRPPLPSTPMPNSPQKMTYITEIKVSPNRETVHETGDSENEEIVAIMENNGEKKVTSQHEIRVTSNGKATSGKKPPVPPRRSDITKISKEEQQGEKQVVYVSEYKSTTTTLGKENSEATNSEGKDSASKKFEQWIFLGDKEQNRWGNGSSQAQPVTSIVLSSGEEKIVHQ